MFCLVYVLNNTVLKLKLSLKKISKPHEQQSVCAAIYCVFHIEDSIYNATETFVSGYSKIGGRTMRRFVKAESLRQNKS